MPRGVEARVLGFAVDRGADRELPRPRAMMLPCDSIIAPQLGENRGD
jgi:hypothetical protein